MMYYTTIQDEYDVEIEVEVEVTLGSRSYSRWEPDDPTDVEITDYWVNYGPTDLFIYSKDLEALIAYHEENIIIDAEEAAKEGDY